PAFVAVPNPGKGSDHHIGCGWLCDGCRLQTAKRRDTRGSRPAQRENLLQGARAQRREGAGPDGGRTARSGRTDGRVTSAGFARPAGRQAGRGDRPLARGNSPARPRGLNDPARQKSIARTFTILFAPAYTPT